MNQETKQSLQDILSNQPKGDGRDWARRILRNARGGLPVSIGMREMAERALKVPRDDHDRL